MRTALAAVAHQGVLPCVEHLWVARTPWLAVRGPRRRTDQVKGSSFSAWSTRIGGGVNRAP